MFPCSSDDFAVSYDLDPPSDDVLSTLAGHLNIHSPSIPLKCWWHVDVSSPGLEVAYFSLLLLDDADKLIDVAASLFKVLLGNGGLVTYGGGKPIGDGVCGSSEVIILIHTEDGFGCAR